MERNPENGHAKQAKFMTSRDKALAQIVFVYRSIVTLFTWRPRGSCCGLEEA